MESTLNALALLNALKKAFPSIRCLDTGYTAETILDSFDCAWLSFVGY
jgi:hypothetical protein